MKTCSEFIKSCGFKSTKALAALAGVSARTIERAYNDDKYAFGNYMIKAANEISKAFMFEVKRNLKNRDNNNG